MVLVNQLLPILILLQNQVRECPILLFSFHVRVLFSRRLYDGRLLDLHHKSLVTLLLKLLSRVGRPDLIRQVCLSFVLINRHVLIVTGAISQSFFIVVLEDLLGILAHFGTLKIRVLVDCLAVAVCEQVEGLRNFSLLDDNLTVVDLSHLYVGCDDHQ
jgi:hypothetical protein